MKQETSMHQHQRAASVWRLAVVAAGFVALTACASTAPAPTQELQAAELAITTAEQNGVADFAAPELNLAREKLVAANTAVQNKSMVQAGYLAEESKVNAELATAKTEMAKAKEVNVEMQKGIDTLKQEMQRNSGVTQ